MADVTHSDQGSTLGDNRQYIEHLLYDQHWKQTTQSNSKIDKLPPETLHQILSFLSPHELARVSITCRALAQSASNDLLWKKLVNSHIPFSIDEPGPFESFRRLYLAHLPYWFIPQNKIWFADNEHTGNLILARYDNRRGVIEAYRILADRGAPMFHVWAGHPDVMIQSFDPHVGLWLDDPVLLLKDPDPSAPTSECQTWMAERSMRMAAESHHLFNSLLLCSNTDTGVTDMSRLWPPALIPSNNRVARSVDDMNVSEPSHWSEASQEAFRIRRWTNFHVVHPGNNSAMVTYSTLDPSVYTPTRTKPYQGIWVGDYSAHGCEFLLITQGDPLTDEEVDNTSGVIQRGSLDAIKLTGDPNVPRGEITFQSPDIGPNGLIRVETEEPFAGCRIVHSRGHVAGRGFRDDTFIASQLILVSTEYIAHYWQEMGHISYYRRVDIDDLLQT
ncbi:hypothetical protein N7532_003771 [Penicillium argentinense]|uniref:F-box domain-containing protein n=1 Tax=Penicillium argentinense TaxID=1131581 RepID=A0A9W9FN53_9EURO|nr:uncharacterized protein N7532_003771 [Penicillium argentinense]KAJ5103242.1 hypothetical protein N7532_003771 [Penicillium argentinense]